MKTWEPEQNFEKADFPVRRGERDDPAPPVVRKRSDKMTGGEEAVPSGGTDRVAELVRQEVLSSPEQTLRFLRRWYWEKWPPAEKIAGLLAVPPHDRLQIIFHLLEERVLRYLFEIMSPIERGRFNEITKKPWHFGTGTVHLVCREFLNGLRDNQ